MIRCRTSTRSSRCNDGSTLAFFEAPELPPKAERTHPAYDIFQHIALEVESQAVVDQWHAWLVSQGVSVVGPVDHKIIYSIYFYDPNGIRLELTTPLDPTWNDQGERAHDSLKEWEQVKATARATGQDMSVVLAELTRQRSHRQPPSGAHQVNEADIPKIISVDDHVVEPAHLWQTWLPTKFREAGPRVERRGVAKINFAGAAAYKEEFDDDSPTKADTWVYENLVYTHKRMVAAVGYPRDEMTMTPITYDDMRPGCYDPKARLADMDVNHVEASACYPTFPRFCGQTFAEGKDKDLGLACVLAYNDWTVDEWCGDSGGRLIPICLIPLWDPQLAAAEVRRNAARGVRAVAFSEIPLHLGLP